MIDATRQLRWFAGLFVAFLAVMPVLSLTLVATDPEASRNELTPVFVAAPINLAGLIFTLVSMWKQDPPASTRRLAIGATLVLIGDIALFSLRALVS